MYLTKKWSDMSTIGISPGHSLGNPSPLFTKIEATDIQKHKSELGPSDQK